MLDRCVELTPDERVPYNTSVIPIIQTYYSLKDTAKANEVLNTYLVTLEQELIYFKDLELFNPNKFQVLAGDFQMNMSALYNLFSLSNSYQQKEMSDKIVEIMQRYDNGISSFLR